MEHIVWGCQMCAIALIYMDEGGDFYCVQAAYERGKGVGDMSEVLAMLLDWATKEGKDLRLFTFDFNKFFDR